ncbi:MAG: flavohemoglobin expression-modulating QEGLA motif protein, partial [Gammaproteobacteria bacterium]|nr:flavohemoglobin expression-modulating QEGLA motif protein [Gammaproteobacteria bacterium]
MAAFSDPELERLEHAAALLLEAEERLPVLKTLAWDRSLADEFFRNAEKRMPCPVYPKIDPTLSLERIAAARAVIDGSSPVHQWLQRFAATLEETAALLASVGTPAFYSHSQVLYGEPQAPIVDGKRTVLELALRLDRLLSDYDVGCVRLEPPESLTAHDLKARLEEELPRHFGADAPKVEVTANVSAKAAAGRDYIKLREDAAFSDLDVTQLLQHEALIHIATTKNGLAQTRFPVLAESHPGNARTQEGLAVFAEFISGALDPRRFKRLADRVIAINMAAEGANFLELYDFFRERSAADTPFEAFESARRVVRGGL